MLFDDFRRIHKRYSPASLSSFTRPNPPRPPKPVPKAYHPAWPQRVASLYTRFTTLYFKVDPEIPPMLILITSVMIGGVYIAVRKLRDPELDSGDERRSAFIMEDGGGKPRQ